MRLLVFNYDNYVYYKRKNKPEVLTDRSQFCR